MSTLNADTWYILQNAVKNNNNTLTAANNTQAAFDPNSPSSIYYAPLGTDTPFSQQWQIFRVNASSAFAYIFRNRQLGSEAYMTTAWSTRKCGGGNCATVPVMAPYLNNQSLWNFGSWGFSDEIGGATIYNLGNTSDWRLDVMYDGPNSELLNTTDTGQVGQHWFVSSHATIATSDLSSYSTIPTTATALLAQFTNAASVTTNPSVITITSSGAPGASNTATGGSTSSPGSTSGSGLSTGAAAGIGVGVGLGVIAILLAAFLLFRRKRKSQVVEDTAAPPSTSIGSNEWYNSKSGAFVSSPPGQEKVINAEMESPAADVSRVELYSPQHEVVPERYEMPHPSNSPRTEMEHPSTQSSTVVSSNEDSSKRSVI